MQHTISLSVDDFPAFLARLPTDLDLDRLAIEHKAIRRSRKIKTGTGLLRLALAHGPGGMSLRDAAGWAGVLGLATLRVRLETYRMISTALDGRPVRRRRLMMPPASHRPLLLPDRLIQDR